MSTDWAFLLDSRDIDFCAHLKFDKCTTQWVPLSTNHRFNQPAPENLYLHHTQGRRCQHDSPLFSSLFPCQSPLVLTSVITCRHAVPVPGLTTMSAYRPHLFLFFDTTNVQTVQHKSNWSQTRNSAPNRWAPNQATKMTLIVEVQHGSVSAIQPNHQLPLTCVDPVFLHPDWNSLFFRSSLPLLLIVRRPRCVPFQDALLYSVKTLEKKKKAVGILPLQQHSPSSRLLASSHDFIHFLIWLCCSCPWPTFIKHNIVLWFEQGFPVCSTWNMWWNISQICWKHFTCQSRIELMRHIWKVTSLQTDKEGH